MRKVSCIFKSKEMKAYWYRQCTDTEWDLRGYLLSYLHFADRDSVDRKTGDRRQLSCPCWWNSSDRHERVGSVWRHWTIVTLQVSTDWCWRNSLWLTRHTLFITVDQTRDTWQRSWGSSRAKLLPRHGHLFCNDIQGSDHGFRFEPNIAQIKSKSDTKTTNVSFLWQLFFSLYGK